MIISYLLILCSTVPIIIFLFGLMDHRHWKTLGRYFIAGGAVALVVFGIAAAMNFHYWLKYHFSFFPIWEEIKIMCWVTGGIFALIFIISALAGVLTNKSIASYASTLGKLTVVFGVFIGSMLMIFIFIMPAGEKYIYSSAIKRAKTSFEEMEKKAAPDDAVAAVLAESGQHCYGKSSTCRDDDYENLVFIKNLHDKEILAQVEVAFFDRNDKVIETIKSGTIHLNPKEAVPLVTKEEVKHNSAWSRWTNRTEDRPYYIQYRYRYKER
ncbi:hypothetical protein [Falsibacillus pallidus]|uniref:hypothetical protein n=1 Tax=Falsibacillus pallidus TaxID=493781 RepID=UPI003D994891